jgi:NAD(P)-dependent dehydrogenase (short-subunit alcohol dehydrogenase family)
MTYDGKVVVITGAAQGIGLEYARRFGDAGATVYLTDIQEDQVKAEAENLSGEGIEAYGETLNIGDAVAFAKLADDIVAKHGHVDVLINNAAIYAGYSNYPLMELPLDYWNRFIDINLSGILNGVQAVAPHMKKAKYGRILIQSSGGASSPRNQYSNTKLGLQALTISLARSLGKYSITVNGIAPGLTDTAATRGHYNDEQLKEMVASRTLLLRMGRPEDIARGALWLASDDAALVTAQVLHVDAGYVMNPA